MTATSPSILGLDRSLSGRTWRWRRGNMDLGGDAAGGGATLDHDLITQLLLARGVAEDDVERHRSPSLRAFLPDPSALRDMDAAAERLAQAVLTGETMTVYGDYDVDGATSAALLIRLLRALGLEAQYYIPDRLLEGYGPSGEALVKPLSEGKLHLQRLYEEALQSDEAMTEGVLPACVISSSETAGSVRPSPSQARGGPPQCQPGSPSPTRRNSTKPAGAPPAGARGVAPPSPWSARR